VRTVLQDLRGIWRLRREGSPRVRRLPSEAFHDQAA
jgi:hypothetical protein